MNKIKEFDCVEMKQKAQISLRTEYESQQGEYRSYYDFLNRSSGGASLWHSLQAKIEQAKHKTVS